MAALKLQSFCIVCSAPEMTTVSKPNKNPARADVMDQKKTCFFILMSFLVGPVRQRGLRHDSRIRLGANICGCLGEVILTAVGKFYLVQSRHAHISIRQKPKKI